jgi:hypothetical protein
MDPHSFEKLDPDPHSPKKLDPGPHSVNADPKHCLKHTVAFPFLKINFQAYVQKANKCTWLWLNLAACRIHPILITGIRPDFRLDTGIFKKGIIRSVTGATLLIIQVTIRDAPDIRPAGYQVG